MHDPVVITGRVKLANLAKEQDAGGWHSPRTQDDKESAGREPPVESLGSDFSSKFSPGAYE